VRKSGIRVVTVPCNQCGSTRSHPIAVGTDREYDNTTADEFTVVECDECGLKYLNPRPETTELEVIYPPNYHAYNIRPADARRELSPVTRLRHRIYALRFRRALKYFPGRSPIDLLDVGCGDGWMLDLYKAADPARIVTYGVDFQKEVCRVAEASGHVVYCGRFEELALPRRFDLVNLSHVIEHVADPRQFVQKVWSVLKPGGIFVLETPNTDTWDWRWFRHGAWGAYHIPRHWTFYDPRSIRRLGESAGFRLREVAFHPAPVHWVWTLHNLSLTRGGWLGALGRRVFSPLDMFRGGAKALLLLSTFSVVDAALQRVSGRTSNMMAIFQKVVE
jgi:2-polyprenyl-3-methyl-5-hydroxy-6-metoxy-1,4-benzoquinol methylase